MGQDTSGGAAILGPQEKQQPFQALQCLHKSKRENKTQCNLKLEYSQYNRASTESRVHWARRKKTAAGYGLYTQMTFDCRL